MTFYLEAKTTMDIRQGLTSQSPLIETLKTEMIPGHSMLVPEYLVPADVGFYIRLRGRLGNQFKMAIAYAAFSYTGNRNRTLHSFRTKGSSVITYLSRMLHHEGLYVPESPLHIGRLAMRWI